MAAKNENCQRFGKRVRRLRKELGLSQEQFADRVGIHRTYIGGIERGERNPTLSTIYRIAQGLKIEASRLLG
ncbi:MAG: helix-turn-helix domain-containing protein [Acidobacteriia bacterium]|nr:helix-turn-helix domain-containing protein [Terriglobia bacterium]